MVINKWVKAIAFSLFLTLVIYTLIDFRPNSNFLYPETKSLWAIYQKELKVGDRIDMENGIFTVNNITYDDEYVRLSLSECANCQTYDLTIKLL